MGPQPSELGSLTAMSQGYGTLTTGTPLPYVSGAEGIMPNNPTGQMLGMIGAPFLQNFLGQRGMAGFGVNTNQNRFDVMQRMKFQESQSAMLRDVAEADRISFMKTMRGMAVLSGTPYGAEQQASAGRIADFLSAAGPIASQMAPELYSQIHGEAGSGFIMGRRMMEANRFRIDPTTGKYGLSAADSAAMTTNMYKDLYSTENIGKMRGLRADQAGDLYGELTRRGMMPGMPSGRAAIGSALQSLPEQELQAAFGTVGKQVKRDGQGNIDLTGLNAKEIQQISSFGPVAGRIKEMDIQQTKQQLQSYTKALGAMKEIFGDAGNPNAPIPELFKAMEALTMGGSHQMSGEKLERSVRNTYYLAKDTGVGIDALVALQTDAGARARQMGLDPIAAISATQHSLAFSAAYRGSGQGAMPVFGGFNADQMTQANTSLMLQAKSSTGGNRLGLLYRLRENLGSEAIKGSELEGVLDAVKEDKTTFKIGGKNVSADLLNDEHLIQLGKGVGINDPSTIRLMLSQKQRNMEQIENNGLDSYIRDKVQPEQYFRTAASAIESLVGGKKEFQGKDIGGKIANALREMPAEVRNDEKARSNALVKVIGDAVPGMSEAEKRALASSAMGELDTLNTRGGFGVFGKRAENALALMDRKTAEGGARIRQSTEIDNDIRKVSKTQSGSVLSNLVEAIKTAGPDSDLLSVAAETLGGGPIGTLSKDLQTGITKTKSAYDTVTEAKENFLNATTDTDKKTTRAALDKAMKEYETAADNLTKIAPEDMKQAKAFDPMLAKRMEDSLDKRQRGRSLGINLRLPGSEELKGQRLSSTKEEIDQFLKSEEGAGATRGTAGALLDARKAAGAAGVSEEEWKQAVEKSAANKTFDSNESRLKDEIEAIQGIALMRETAITIDPKTGAPVGDGIKVTQENKLKQLKAYAGTKEGKDMLRTLKADKAMEQQALAQLRRKETGEAGAKQADELEAGIKAREAWTSEHALGSTEDEKMLGAYFGMSNRALTTKESQDKYLKDSSELDKINERIRVSVKEASRQFGNIDISKEEQQKFEAQTMPKSATTTGATTTGQLREEAHHKGPIQVTGKLSGEITIRQNGKAKGTMDIASGVAGQ